jgi:hypothetical protein
MMQWYAMHNGLDNFIYLLVCFTQDFACLVWFIPDLVLFVCFTQNLVIFVCFTQDLVIKELNLSIKAIWNHKVIMEVYL